jgi:hypothetical protein
MLSESLNDIVLAGHDGELAGVGDGRNVPGAPLPDARGILEPFFEVAEFPEKVLIGGRSAAFSFEEIQAPRDEVRVAEHGPRLERLDAPEADACLFRGRKLGGLAR